MNRFCLPLVFIFVTNIVLGQSWTQQPTMVSDLLSSISMSDTQIGWAFSEQGKILSTTDGGQDWSPTLINPNFSFLCSQVLEDSIIISAGEHVLTEGFFMRSENWGQNWIIDSLSFPERILDLYFLNSQVGWVVGRDGMIRHTINGGQTWQGQFSNSTERLLGISAINSMNVWVCGKNGTLLHTSDGGQTWNTANSPSSEDWQCIYFQSSSLGWIAGEGGTLFKTTNGGITWSSVASGTLHDINRIDFASTIKGIFVGTQSTLSETLDGGNTWMGANHPLIGDLLDISIVDSNHVWVCGSNGGIASFQNSVVVQADFETQGSVCIGDTNHFTDKSTGDPINWYWKLGNDSAVGAQVTYVFPDTGLQVVQLIVANSAGSIDTIEQTVRVYPQTQAGFLFSPDTLDLNQANIVQFTDTSSFANQWFWDFGNQTTSQLQNPARAYQSSGTYMITLIAQNEQCQDTSFAELFVINSTDLEDKKLHSSPYLRYDPSQRSLIFQWEAFGEIRWQLLNSEGKIVLQTTSRGELKMINCNDLSPGLYYLNCRNSGGLLRTKKVIIF